MAWLLDDLSHFEPTAIVWLSVKFQVKNIVRFLINNGLLVTECERIELTFAVGFEVYSSKHYEALMITLGARERYHGVRPPGTRHLVEHCKGFPSHQVAIVDANVVQGDVTSRIVNSIVTAPV